VIGVQNGVTPNRVVAFDLDRMHSRILAAHALARDTTRIREPTHLVAAGDDIFFIANGGFGLYDERGNLKPASPRLRRQSPDSKAAPLDVRGQSGSSPPGVVIPSEARIALVPTE
jgi:hypothetical protein